VDGYRKSTYFLHYNISLIHTSSDSQVEEQVAVLNHDYRETGLSFVLANTSRTIDAEWFTSAGPDNNAQDSMKSTLRRGDATTLNVYTVGFQTSGGLLGYSTFPADYDSKPSDDGVGTYSVNYLDITSDSFSPTVAVILYSSLPGGTEEPYNFGQTLTHEVGHWVGLYHTFQGGCRDGDFVVDTPPQSSPTFGCPATRDSCSSPGIDPIRMSLPYHKVVSELIEVLDNYMDYSDDQCMTEFTPGQTERLTSQLATYRSLFV